MVAAFNTPRYKPHGLYEAGFASSRLLYAIVFILAAFVSQKAAFASVGRRYARRNAQALITRHQTASAAASLSPLFVRTEIRVPNAD